MIYLVCIVCIITRCITNGYYALVTWRLQWFSARWTNNLKVIIYIVPLLSKMLRLTLLNNLVKLFQRNFVVIAKISKPLCWFPPPLYVLPHSSRRVCQALVTRIELVCRQGGGPWYMGDSDATPRVPLPPLGSLNICYLIQHCHATATASAPALCTS